MNILLATSEAVPFAKTGGLADVCGALPIELARLGHQVAVILPGYRQTRYCGQPIEPLGIDFIVPIGSKMVTGHLAQSTMPGGTVPVYLVQQDQYFDRDQLYGADGKDYIDNCERFVFFSRAVLEAIRLLDLHVDVLHANDWQTGLVPAYLKIDYHARAALPADRHAVHHPQHRLPGPVLALGHAPDRPGLEVFQLAPDGVLRQAEPAEDRAGLRRLDQHGQPALRPGDPDAARWAAAWKACCSTAATCSSGILNGIDDSDWNPATDPHLPARYTPTPWPRASRSCKAALAEGTGPAAGAARAAGRLGRPADRPEGLRPDCRGHPALGADQRRAMGHPGHRPAEVSPAVREPGPAAIRTRSPCGWSSPIRWPIASRPAATSSSCPAASSRAD